MMARIFNSRLLLNCGVILLATTARMMFANIESFLLILSDNGMTLFRQLYTISTNSCNCRLLLLFMICTDCSAVVFVNNFRKLLLDSFNFIFSADKQSCPRLEKEMFATDSLGLNLVLYL